MSRPDKNNKIMYTIDYIRLEKKARENNLADKFEIMAQDALEQVMEEFGVNFYVNDEGEIIDAADAHCDEQKANTRHAQVLEDMIDEAINEREAKTTISDSVKRVLDSKGMTQRELADRLHIHHVSLNAMLRNDNFKVETLERFADAIGCEVADFFSRPKFVCPHCGEEIHITLS